MKSLKTALNHFAESVSRTAGVYTTLIMIFTYNVLLDKDLACTCKEQPRDCWLYMLIPAALIFILILWMDTTFQRTFKYLCGGCLEGDCGDECESKRRFCCVFWYHILKAAFVGSLWFASVLIDGDWYVCCYNDQSEQQKDLACKNKADITAEERGIMAGLINRSRVIGLSLLLAITFLAAFISSIPFRKCCTETWKCCTGCHTAETFRVEEIVLEEGKNLISATLREAAKVKMTEKLKSHVTNEEWEKCFDVLEKVVRDILKKKNMDTQNLSHEMRPLGPSSHSQEIVSTDNN